MADIGKGCRYTMRYTPTLKLSTRLVAFVTMIVVSAMFILFIGGTLSLRSLGKEYVEQSLQGIVEVVDKEMEDPDAAYSMQRWMPKMLQASNIIEMQLSSSYGVVYRYKDTSTRLEEGALYEKTYVLERNNGYSITFKVRPPYLGYNYSLQAFSSLSLAIALVVFCLVRGVKWLKEQLIGSELLEERGRMILAGRVEPFAKGDEREWPYTASEALDRLIEELQDARQERSRFDTFIRTQTFLDKLTGTANRVLFDSKLESALSESGAQGAVFLIRLDDWDSVVEEVGLQQANEFIVEVGHGLSNLIQRYPDVTLSRYYDAEFAIFAPNVNSKEVNTIATQCLKQMNRIVPPAPLDAENWCHIGVTNYQEGERQNRIMDEVETAVKSAKLQQMNTWNRFDKAFSKQDERGSVRWRALFDQVMVHDKIIVFEQACYLFGEQNQNQFDHSELFMRLRDPEKGILKASKFVSAIEMVGYQAVMDKTMLPVVIEHLKRATSAEKYSVNLYVTPFSERDYFKWFRNELLQLSIRQRAMLIFEFPESKVVKHLDYMRPVIKTLSGLGCQVAINQAGRSIVSTHYLKELPISYMKLHRSLIKRIDQRHENQLFVRSILGACEGSGTKVIAVGVDSDAERRTLIDLGVQGIQGRLLAAEQQMIPPPERNDSLQVATKVQVGRRNRWRKK